MALEYRATEDRMRYLLCLFVLLGCLNTAISRRCIDDDPCDPSLPCNYEAGLQDILASPQDCHAMQICAGPMEWVTYELCKGSEVFDHETCACANKTCTSWSCGAVEPAIPYQEPCFVSTPDAVCGEGERLPDRYTCSWYHQCESGRWVCYKCPPELPFFNMYVDVGFSPCEENLINCEQIPFSECNTYGYTGGCVRFFTTEPDLVTTRVSTQRDDVTTQRDDVTTQRDAVTTKLADVITQRDAVTTQLADVTTPKLATQPTETQASAWSGRDSSVTDNNLSNFTSQNPLDDLRSTDTITSAQPGDGEDDDGGLSQTEKIIIGCVCGGVALIILIILLVCLLQKNYVPAEEWQPDVGTEEEKYTDPASPMSPASDDVYHFVF